MPSKKLTDSFIRTVTPPKKKRDEYYDTIVKGLSLRVTKKGTKSFSYEYKGFDGSKKRLTIGAYGNITLKQARDKCREAKQKLIQGVDPKEEIDQNKKREFITMNELAKKYESEYLPTLSNKTQQEYKRYIQDRILKKFGNRNPNDISRLEIIEFLDRIAYTEGRKVTSNRVQATFSGLYTYGINKSLISEDPTKAITKKEEKSKERVYTDNEVKSLWEFFSDMNKPTGDLYKILLLLARRKTEVMVAKWSHVDLDEETWLFPKENVKTNTDLLLPLTDFSISILDDLRKYSGNSDYIFLSPVKINSPLTNDSYARKKVKEESEVSDFTPHDLRRTAITTLAKIRTPEHIAKKISNISQNTSDDIFRVYNRYEYLEEMKEALTKYHDLTNKIINK